MSAWIWKCESPAVHVTFESRSAVHADNEDLFDKPASVAQEHIDCVVSYASLIFSADVDIANAEILHIRSHVKALTFVTFAHRCEITLKHYTSLIRATNVFLFY